MKKTTLNKLKNDKCYCSKIDDDISLKDCDSFNCKRWKKCMKKTNNDTDKDLKRRQKGGKTI